MTGCPEPVEEASMRSICPRARLAALPLAGLLFVSVPASAGLVYEWVSVNVYEGPTVLELDPGLATGRIELADGVRFGDLVTESEVQSVAFDDSMFDFWDETFLSTAALIPERTGLGIGSGRLPPRTKALPPHPTLKEASMTFAATVDDDGNPSTGPRLPLKRHKAALTLETGGKVKVHDFRDPAIPADATLWFWETQQDSVVAYSGTGYWSLDPASAPAPEPGALFLIGAGLVGAGLLRRRRR
jgi:hypothetical protein